MEKLGKKAAERGKERAKEKVENKVEETVDKNVDKVFDAAGNAVKGGDKNKGKQAQVKKDSLAQRQQTVPKDKKSTEMAYAKSDFVPGDVLIFEDDVQGEQLGEVPAKWDLLEGSVEIVSLNGETVIQLSQNGHITPLMEDIQSYLTEEFTIEFDFWVNDQDETTQAYYLHFQDKEDNDVLLFDVRDTEYRWSYMPGSSGNNRSGVASEVPYLKNRWNHFALSFNKRAMKAYLSTKMSRGRQAAYYINEGLLIDPEHEGLNVLLKAYNKEGDKP